MHRQLNSTAAANRKPVSIRRSASEGGGEEGII
jgi:hypothetical protein